MTASGFVTDLESLYQATVKMAEDSLFAWVVSEYRDSFAVGGSHSRA